MAELIPKKVFLSFRMPKPGEYIGGVAALINQCLDCSELFAFHGYRQKLCSLTDENNGIIKNSKVRNVIDAKRERRLLLSEIDGEFDPLVHIHTSRGWLYMKDVALARYLKKKTGAKTVMTIHVGALKTVFLGVPKIARSFFLPLMNRHVDKAIFLNEKIKKEFLEVGLLPDKAEVLYNFSSLPVSSNKTISCTNAGVINLLFVGMIRREKGINELLDALAGIEDIPFHLDICGEIVDSSEASDINEKLSALGSKVALHGYVSGDNKARLFEKADVLVLPSYHEGLPLVILEALSAGCAIISTKVGSIPEVLTNENALWVRPQSIDDVRSAIEKLWENRELASSMKRANKRLAKKFSAEAYVETVCKIYDEVLLR